MVKNNQAKTEEETLVVEPVIGLVSTLFFDLLEEIFGVECATSNYSDYSTESFDPADNTIAYIDFVGSVTGVVAIAADAKVFAKCFDMDSTVEAMRLFQSLESPLKEVMNTVVGKCLRLMVKQYMAVTMLTPRIIFGQVSYPKVKCYCKTVETAFGDVSFYYSVDHMKLEMVRAMEKLEATESKTQDVLRTMSGLHERLELAQTKVLSEVSSIMSKMAAIDDYFMPDESESANAKGMTFPMESLIQTKDDMTKRLSDTIHYLTVFRNMIMSDLQVRRTTEGDMHLEVNLSGFVIDTSDLSFMQELDGGKLIINTKNVMNHTPSGLQVWVNHIRRVNQDVRITFIECSAEFLSMVLENHHAVGHGEVESISAHYHCHSCLYKDEVTFFLDCDISEWQLPEVVCVCGKKMTLWEGYSQGSITDYLNLINKLGHSSSLLAATVEIVDDDRRGLSH